MNSNPVICERCQNALATVHVKERINGKETNRHLCSACAAKEGLTGSAFASSLWEGDPFENLLGSFFLPNRSGGIARCSTCGRSLSDIKRTGRFGCSECYAAFERRVDLAPFTSPEGYKGKRPVGSETEAASAKDPVKETKAPSKEERMVDLKARLKQAVEQEEYEKAAKLRDELRALEGKEEK